MPHIYTTHVVQENNCVQCKHCLNTLKPGDEFAVTSTRSKPYQPNCLPCTDKRLDAGEHGFGVDNTVGDHPGNQRAAS